MLINRFHTAILLTAIGLYIATAFLSTGYYHPDEHFQIVEFAGLKLGAAIPEDLPWEYHKQMRSAIQPALCYMVLKGLPAIHIVNTYEQAFVLRLISAFFSIFVMYRFLQATLHIVKTSWQKAYMACSYFLWFLPFLSVRFSSENWSGLFFLWALSCILQNRQMAVRHYIVIGLLLGMAFLFRYQTLILTAGTIAWLLIIRKQHYKHILVLLITLLLTVQAGILIDGWFYGEYVYAFWNYLYTTLLAGTPPMYGTAPWYFYLMAILTEPAFLIGAYMLFSLIIVSIKMPQHVAVWTVIPFILIHSFIAHKELRFLFPVARLAPLLIFIGLEQAFTWYRLYKKVYLKYAISLFLIGAMLMNSVAILVASFTPAGTGAREITRYINSKYKGRPKHLFLLCSHVVYDFREEFYYEGEIEITKLHSLKELDKVEMGKKEVNLLVVQKSVLPVIKHHSKLLFKKEKQSMPGWISSIVNFYNELDEEPALTLYSIQ